MKKNQKNYTLLLIKNDSSYVKRISFKQNTLNLALFFVFAIFLSLSLFLSDYLGLYIDKFKITQLEKENQNWTKKMANLELQISTLEDQVRQAGQFSKKIQLITNNNLEKDLVSGQRMGKIHSNPTLIALTAPTPEKESRRDPSSAMDTPVSSGVLAGELEIRIEKLKGKATLIKEDSWNLYTNLLEKQELLNNTPSILPVKGWISSHFGYRNESIIYGDHEPRFHRGMDIAAGQGALIHSTADGKVTYTGYDDSGFGNLIIVDHGYGLETYYGHLSEIQVTHGQTVKKKEVIGKVGNTGRSTGPHLHYEVRIYGIPVNPINYVVESSEILNLSLHSH